MIYKLPTKGATKYGGAYPTRIRAVSAGQGVVFVELNDGGRYVALSREFVDLPRYGKPIAAYVKQHWHSRVVAMTDAQYAAYLRGPVAPLYMEKADRLRLMDMEPLAN